MRRSARILLSVPLTMLAVSAAFAGDTTTSNERRVREYVAAFNDRNIDSMLMMVTDDVQWLTVAGDSITVETSGKARLRESLESYFTSVPSARSTVEWAQSTGSRVAAMERASWQGKSGPKSQAGLSVYEFDGALISRVYYYPAER